MSLATVWEASTLGWFKWLRHCQCLTEPSYLLPFLRCCVATDHFIRGVEDDDYTFPNCTGGGDVISVFAIAYIGKLDCRTTSRLNARKENDDRPPFCAVLRQQKSKGGPSNSDTVSQLNVGITIVKKLKRLYGLTPKPPRWRMLRRYSSTSTTARIQG